LTLAKAHDSSQQQSFKPKAKAQMEGKSFRNKKRGPIKIWVPRNEIVYILGKTRSKTLDSILEP